jgi:hypothetical protein
VSCHPGTRREALSVLSAWTSDSANAASSILWLKGPTGVGKSAILGTLMQRLHAAGRPGAGFVFCRQQSPQQNVNALFCTLAYQLAINTPHIRASISRAVKLNPGIVGETMDVQLQELILRPYRDGILSHPLVLVIDGLDKFTYDVQREILTLLGNAARTQSLPLRIFIASTLQHPIAGILADSCFHGLWRSFDVERSLEDVRLYLWAELARIQGNLGFSTHVLDALVEASAGCFLYASTLIRFLADADFPPMKRLAAIESFPFRNANSSLDRLYTQILAAVPLSMRVSLLAFLHILTTKEFAGLPVYHLEQLLRITPRRFRRILRHLRSVLNVPPSANGSVTVHHISFLDFLIDPARSDAFCVSGAERSMHLVCCILESLTYTHQNPRVNCVGHISW